MEGGISNKTTVRFFTKLEENDVKKILLTFQNSFASGYECD